jgi:hypothetical protein
MGLYFFSCKMVHGITEQYFIYRKKWFFLFQSLK